uniref:SRCR domain-containing protein n=1 Tax=Mastacembelus armatus TaxID=205130 RepID=A0A7N9AS27_9TELE
MINWCLTILRSCCCFRTFILRKIYFRHYTILNDDWRSTNNTSNQIIHCDRDVNWQGWYRLFPGQTSAHIPERCVEKNRCGTHAPLWITEPHPTQSGEIVNRTVCNTWMDSCCYFNSHNIHIADGGNSSCSGRVEIFHSGQWGTARDDGT